MPQASDAKDQFRKAARKKTGEALRVLVVDDDALTSRAMAAAVTALGHEALRAESGRRALELFHQVGADVVLSDWWMPGMDGLELCRQIREQTGDGRYVYFVLVSGHAGDAERLAAMHGGADDVLAKPLGFDDLSARLTVAKRVTAAHRRLAHDNRVLRRESQRALAAAMIDPLTGALNRRQLEVDLGALCSGKNGRPAALAMVDVDRFKAYNDHCGHLAGDAALKEIVRVALLVLRKGDAIYRYGGEEFVVLMHDTDEASAAAAMERLREAVKKLVIAHAGSQTGYLTVSAGICVGPLASPEAWIAKADAALYRAKATGRNRVELG